MQFSLQFHGAKEKSQADETMGTAPFKDPESNAGIVPGKSDFDRTVRKNLDEV
jgi:hypothetical protein